MSQIADVRLVIESSACPCGANILRVDAVDDRRDLRCESCGLRRGVLSDRSTDFILAICREYGPPEKPIVLRRPQQTNSA
jgi:ribosomal protein S14